MCISLIILGIFELMTYKKIDNWIRFPKLLISSKSDNGEKSYTYFTSACQAGNIGTTFVIAYHICDALSRRSSALGRNQLLSDEICGSLPHFSCLVTNIVKLRQKPSIPTPVWWYLLRFVIFLMPCHKCRQLWFSATGNLFHKVILVFFFTFHNL